MFKTKNNEKLNICGTKVAQLRKEMVPKTSQKKLAFMLQEHGIELDKNAIQRIESGKRFVTDIELKALANLFGVTAEELLNNE